MSVRIMSLVWEIELPDSEKIVLLALADCANDEGHCWPGVASLMKKCSKGERTIQGAIKSLCYRGHLTRREVLGKGCNYTVHPRKECTPAEIAPRSEEHRPPQGLRETPAGIAGKPSLNRKEPSPPKIAHALPAEWEPKEFGRGTESRKVVDGWPPGEFAVQLELFKAQHGKKGDQFIDWQQAWSTWVLNTRKFGIGRNYERPDNPTTIAVQRVLGAIQAHN